MSTATTTPGRTYEVRTYGCQMNVHDSERLTGLLEDAGYVAAADGDLAVRVRCVRDDGTVVAEGHINLWVTAKK